MESKETLLERLKRDTFNGNITISDFEKRVMKYAEMYHNEQLLLKSTKTEEKDLDAQAIGLALR